MSVMQKLKFTFDTVVFSCAWILTLGEFKLLLVFLPNINKAPNRNKLLFHFQLLEKETVPLIDSAKTTYPFPRWLAFSPMEKEQREKYDAAQKACKPCHSVLFLKVLFDSSAGKLVGAPPSGSCSVTGALRAVPVCPFALLLWSRVLWVFLFHFLRYVSLTYAQSI